MYGGWAVLVAAIVSVATTSTVLAQRPQCPGWRDPAGKKIVGGAPASRALWPSLAALRLTAPDGKESMFVYGGTAIAADRVLTAAHCFDDIERQADGRYVSTDAGNKTVGWTLDLVLGLDDLATAMTDASHPVAEVTMHERYVKKAATTKATTSR